MTTISLSPEALAYFIELAEDAPDWSGSPLIGGNVEQTKQRDGYLTDLKKKDLLTTQEDEGDVWVYFTPAGRGLAAEHGIALSPYDWE